jgi:hypothetical protein
MARIRSPNYPAISLAEAIKRVEQVHARERQHPATREVIIKGMGYNGVHGTSLSAISAAIKYGLLEQHGKGGEYRVSDRAVAILHPHTAEEKAEAIHAAAISPALFAELLEHFKGGLPSDDNLRAYLVRRGFSQRSLPEVIQSFRDTMELVSPLGTGYAVLGSEPGQQMRQPETHYLRAQPLTTGVPALGSPRSGTASVKIEDDRIEVAAVLLFQENIEDLIAKLQAIKGLRPRASDVAEKKDEAAN